MDSIAVIGLGNIGSAIVPLVARMPGVSRITLVDPDDYASSNLATQAIDSADIGRPKVDVQAAAVAAIDERIEVEAIRDRIENVPMGLIRESILLSCVDNRRARQTINRFAWRSGVPWIDAAIGAPSLVRVGAYLPGSAASCLECRWDERSYDLLEQEYPCNAGEVSIAATDGPAELGALVASLQAAELRKLLNGTPNGESLIGMQLMHDTASQSGRLCRFERSDACRFDHVTWSDITPVPIDPAKATLADLFAAADAGAESSMRLDGHCFATFVDCVACGKRSGVGLSVYGRLDEHARTCGCGGRMFATGFFSFEAIKRSELSSATRRLVLSELGLRVRDVVSVATASGDVIQLEIMGEDPDD